MRDDYKDQLIRTIAHLESENVLNLNRIMSLKVNFNATDARAEKLELELASTKKMLDEAKEVIGFYMWQGKYHGYSSNKSGEWETYPAQIIEDGGKVARSFLAKHEKKEGVNG